MTDEPQVTISARRLMRLLRAVTGHIAEHEAAVVYFMLPGVREALERAGLDLPPPHDAELARQIDQHDRAVADQLIAEIESQFPPGTFDEPDA